MSDSPDHWLLAENLTRRFGQDGGVQGINLSLRQGEVLGLLGLNGAGKSTTLRLLAGVLVPDEGRVQIAGLDLNESPVEARAQLGFLPDTPPVYPDMKVIDWLRFCGRLYRLQRPVLDQRLEAVLSECDLEAVSGKRIETLSRGFIQRVGLAQTILHEPQVLLLDEPGNGLDPHQMQVLREVIAGQSERGAAVVFSTHLLREAQTVCTRVAILHQGRLASEQPLNAGDTTLEQHFDAVVRGQQPLMRANAQQPSQAPPTERDVVHKSQPAAQQAPTPDLSEAD